MFNLIVNYDMKRSVIVQTSTALLAHTLKEWLGPPPI